MNVIGSMHLDMSRFATAFRRDGKPSWRDHHPRPLSATEWFFRTGTAPF
jgi:hypothetical protein